MPDCPYCDDAFDTEHALHLHLREHWDELSSHDKEEVKAAEKEQERLEKRRRERKERRRRHLRYGAAALIAIGLVAFGAAQVIEFSVDTPTAGDGAFQDANMSEQPLLGDSDAPVTITVFADYRCPYCRQFETQVLPRLKTNYIETGKANLRFVNFPFLGPGSTKAAIAAECVYKQDPQGFWDFHRAVYQRQGPERKRWVTTDLLVSIANRTTDVGARTLRTCIRNRETLPAVRHDRSLGEQVGVSGTPAVYVNGQPVKNWRYNNLATVIDSRLG